MSTSLGSAGERVKDVRCTEDVLIVDLVDGRTISVPLVADLPRTAQRSGAWWLEANGNAMLRIRCALYNGTFERIFSDYMATHAATGPSP